MSNLFNPPDPPEPPPMPERSDAEVQEAARTERRRQALATGRSDTILTSSQGAQQSGGQIGQKTLLGE